MAVVPVLEPASRSRMRVTQMEEVARGCTPLLTVTPGDDGNQSITQDDISFADTNPDTILRVAGSWIDDGFFAGDTIKVDGSTSNDAIYNVALVTEKVLTLILADTLTVEAAGATVTVAVQRAYVIPHRDNTFLQQQQTFERSTEVKSTRMGGQQVGGTKTASGTVSVPLKLDDGVKALLQSAFSGTFARVASAAGVIDSWTFADADPDTITRVGPGSFLTDGLRPGDLITVDGTVSNNGQFTIDTVTALVITLIITDALVAEVAVTTASLVTERECMSANATRHFFSYEVAFLDTAIVEYEYFFGMEVNTATINVPTSGEVFSDFEMVGIDAESTTTQKPEFIDGTPPLTGQASILNSADSVPFAGSVTGSQLESMATALQGVETLTITVNNNRAAKFQVGSNLASHVEEGDFDVELTLSIYFTDSALQTLFLDGTRTDLELTVVDQQDGHKLEFDFPQIVFTSGEKALSGQTITQNFTAFAEEEQTLKTKAVVYWIPAVFDAPQPGAAC